VSLPLQPLFDQLSGGLSKQAKADLRHAALKVPVATVSRFVPKSDLARNLEVESSYMTRILKLTALATNVVEAIINGKEPDGLSQARLIHSFAEELSYQRALFGFEDIS
jgi:hypothetical protein